MNIQGFMIYIQIKCAMQTWLSNKSFQPIPIFTELNGCSFDTDAA